MTWSWERSFACSFGTSTFWIASDSFAAMASATPASCAANIAPAIPADAREISEQEFQVPRPTFPRCGKGGPNRGFSRLAGVGSAPRTIAIASEWSGKITDGVSAMLWCHLGIGTCGEISARMDIHAGSGNVSLPKSSTARACIGGTVW